MNNNESFNRRDFLKSGSVATLMTVFGGGVELMAQTNAAPGTTSKTGGPKVKIAVIGLGSWAQIVWWLVGVVIIALAVLLWLTERHEAPVRRAHQPV